MAIRRGKNLVLQVQKDILQNIQGIEELVQSNIGAIYKGTQLIWLTVYNAVKSCFGSGIWLEDKPWLDDDVWKNN